MYRLLACFVLFAACEAPVGLSDLGPGPYDAAKVLPDGGSSDMLALPPSRVVVEYAVIDGQRAPSGFYDTVLNTRCQPLLTTAGQRCVPSDQADSTGVGGYFFDTGCTRQLAISFSGCSAPKYLFHGGGACKPYRLYTLGAPVIPAAVYIGTPGACSASTVAPTLVYSPVIAEIDPTTLSSVSYVH